MEYIEGRGKTEEDAILDAISKLGVTREEIDIEVIKQEGKKMFGLMGEETITVRACMKHDLLKVSRAVKVLEDILLRMGSNGKVEKEENNGNEVILTIIGGEGGLLIGKNGETLDALEHVVSLIVNNDPINRLFISVDTENYRYKRREELEELAQKAAIKVMTTGDSYKIQNLNAKERKIIHIAIQNEEYLETLSCGEGYNRTIIIKKKESESGSQEL